MKTKYDAPGIEDEVLAIKYQKDKNTEPKYLFKDYVVLQPRMKFLNAGKKIFEQAGKLKVQNKYSKAAETVEKNVY